MRVLDYTHLAIGAFSVPAHRESSIFIRFSEIAHTDHSLQIFSNFKATSLVMARRSYLQ